MVLSTPAEVVDAIVSKGVSKVGHSMGHTLLQGAMAGIYIALGCMFSILVAGGCPDLPIGIVRLLAGITFPVGLVCVVLLGADLFTGDVMYCTVAWLQKRVQTKRMLQYYAVVYLGNFIGSVLAAAWLGMGTNVIDKEPWMSYAIKVAEGKVSYNWGVTFLKGASANFLVNLALFGSMVATDVVGKVVAIWPPITMFVACGFEHSVANMFFIPFGMMENARVSLGQFLWNNLIPATLGNVVGGAILVGVVQWVTFGRSKRTFTLGHKVGILVGMHAGGTGHGGGGAGVGGCESCGGVSVVVSGSDGGGGPSTAATTAAPAVTADSSCAVHAHFGKRAISHARKEAWAGENGKGEESNCTSSSTLLADRGVGDRGDGGKEHGEGDASRDSLSESSLLTHGGLVTTSNVAATIQRNANTPLLAGADEPDEVAPDDRITDMRRGMRRWWRNMSRW